MYQTLQINDPTADLELIVHGNRIQVHKSFLESKSNRFQSLFSERWQQFELKEYTEEIILKYIEFLYHDQVEITPNDVESLYDLSICYCEQALQQFIERKLLEEWNGYEPEVYRNFSEMIRFRLSDHVIVTFDNLDRLETLANAVPDLGIKSRCDEFLSRDCFEKYVTASRLKNTEMLSRFKRVIYDKFRESPEETQRICDEWSNNLVVTTDVCFDLYELALDDQRMRSIFEKANSAIVAQLEQFNEDRWNWKIGKNQNSNRVSNVLTESTTFEYIANFLQFLLKYGTSFVKSQFTIFDPFDTFMVSLLQRYNFSRWPVERISEMIPELRYLTTGSEIFTHTNIIMFQIKKLIFYLHRIESREHRLEFFRFLDEPTTIRAFDAIGLYPILSMPLGALFELKVNTTEFARRFMVSEKFYRVLGNSLQRFGFDLTDPSLDGIIDRLCGDYPEITDTVKTHFATHASLSVDNLEVFVTKFAEVEIMNRRLKEFIETELGHLTDRPAERQALYDRLYDMQPHQVFRDILSQL